LGRVVSNLKGQPGFRRFATSPIRTMRIVAIPNQEDNYSYLLIDRTNKAAAIDIFDVRKVEDAAKREGVQIVANLTTHHHHDHTGGNNTFSSKHPDVPVYGGKGRDGKVEIPALTNPVKDDDEFTIGDHVHVKCLATPCHTQDSICYYATDTADEDVPGGVFTGDTLFIAGCGKFFEGTSAQMHGAFSKLGKLPEDTFVYAGHEYTAGNLAFAKTVLGDEEPAIVRLAKVVKENKITVGQSTIGDEKAWNVFMRLGTDAEKMQELRDKKDKYKG